VDTHLVAAIALAAAVYGAACWVLPFAYCRHCHGVGSRLAGIVRKTPRVCRWCRGTGRRMRFGRRVWNTLARRQHRAQVRSQVGVG
jgi:hypothetical protein